MSVVVILWTDVQDGRGGVTAGGDDRLTGDSLALLSGALSGLMQVAFFWQFIKWFDFLDTEILKSLWYVQLDEL